MMMNSSVDIGLVKFDEDGSDLFHLSIKQMLIQMISIIHD